MFRSVITTWLICFVAHQLVLSQEDAERKPTEKKKATKPVTPGEVHFFNRTPITGRGLPNNWMDFERPNIWGGTKADIKQFPSVVFILRNMHPVGMGVLLNNNYVLTTAYNALYDDWCSIRIRAGSNSPFMWGESRRIARKYVHPQFNYTWEHNLALLLVREPILQSPVIDYVRFARVIPPEQCKCNVVGTGTNNLNWQILLEKVHLQAATHTKCNLMYNNPASDFKDRAFCVPSTKKGPCHWNFGAPMFTPRGSLVGLYLGTHGCNRDYEFGVYIQIYYYRQWIKRFLETSLEQIDSTEIDLFDRAIINLKQMEYEYY